MILNKVKDCYSVLCCYCPSESVLPWLKECVIIICARGISSEVLSLWLLVLEVQCFFFFGGGGGEGTDKTLFN